MLIRFLAVVLWTVAVATAQLQLTTTFADNNGGSVGGAVYFDLDAVGVVSIHSLDLNFWSPLGTVGSVDVYAVRGGSYIDNSSNAAAWTLVGSAANVVSNGPGVPSPAVLGTTIQLIGSAGFAVVANGLGHAYKNPLASTHTFTGTNLTLTAGRASNTPFLFPMSRIVNVTVNYSLGATFAQAMATGSACGSFACQPAFYETFATTAFDLANTSFTLLYNSGTGTYTVGPGSGTYTTPAGTALPAGDDVATNVSLPFALPFPGGSTTSLAVCSNGFVSAGPNHTQPSPTPSILLDGAPCWAALWHNLDPAANTMRADVNASRAIISFTDVANRTGGGTATFQFQFFPNGNVHVIYQAIALAGGPYVVGFSCGGGVDDPGNWDISANLAGGLVVCSDPVPNMTFAASAAPIQGTTINLNTNDIPFGSLVGMVFLSLTQFTPGIDLGFLDMPNCTLYAAPDVILSFLTPGPSGTLPWFVPTDASLTGVPVIAQSATFSPGINPFGMATSNGLQLLLESH